MRCVPTLAVAMGTASALACRREPLKLRRPDAAGRIGFARDAVRNGPRRIRLGADCRPARG